MKLDIQDEQLVEALVQYIKNDPEARMLHLVHLEDLLCALRDVADMLEAAPVLHTALLELRWSSWCFSLHPCMAVEEVDDAVAERTHP